MKKAFLPLLFLSAWASAGSLEIRKVVAAGEGFMTVKLAHTSPAITLTMGDTVIVSDKHVQSATIAPERPTRVQVTLNEEGAKRLKEATATGRGTLRLAILVDGKAVAAPIVQDQNSSRIEISGLDDANQAKELAAKLARKK